jgi:hypothetical protein
MFTKAVSRRSVGLFQKALIVLLALAVLFVSLPLDRAYAFYSVPQNGKAGSVSLPTIYVGDKASSCTRIYNSTVCAPTFTLYGETGPIAYRSPAFAGSQIVQAIYVVERWDGSNWVATAKSDVLQGQIGLGQTSVQFVKPHMQVQVAQGYFRFSWLFSWLSSTGAVYGSTIVVSNLTTDHVCVTPARLCQVYPGFVRTGGYLTGKW